MKHMRKEKKRNFRRVKQVLISSLAAIVILGVFVFVTYGRDMPVLDPKGLIANQERDLIIFTFALGMFVVIPVFIMLFTIAWRYREGNTKARYEPEVGGNRLLELIWWGIPCIIILILGIVTVLSTHALDPYKPINSSVQPVKIQAVSLNWRWLFIYPDEGIATVNYINIPKDTPINFTITSDAPMNTLWIPALAGQVYAMSGMSTQLHMMADTTGTYRGSSTNISGDGYADMNFKVNSMNESDYKKWAEDTFSATTNPLLTDASYKVLANPSHDTGQKTYLLMDYELYNKIIMKYMAHDMSDMKAMDMSGMKH
ncbi:ubiquinol oxidase subunit II [Candidatus Saccharibacteria bacterium]|nr:ubiquinol oxidase subunit II [Candidatus Saccharibacteria bacterium]